MDLYQAIRERRSIRHYEDRPIEEDKLLRVLEAARIAPSARNVQEWRYIVVRDAETRKRLCEAAKGQASVAEAPVVIAACGSGTDYIMTCGQAAYTVDLAIGTTHLALAAAAEGLGTCWLGAFHEDKARAILGVPDSVRVVALLTMGYPAEHPAPRPRKTLEEIVAWEKWS
jgi:nitroreductase